MKKKKMPKTALWLVALLIFLGAWGLPALSAQLYSSTNPAPDNFPVVLETRYEQSSQLYLSTVKSVNSGMENVKGKFDEHGNRQHKGTFFLEKKGDFEATYYHVYFAPKKNYYELKLVTPISTSTYTYKVVDKQVTPISLRHTGWIMWLYAAGIVGGLTLTIALIQFGLGITRSATISPRAKKRSQKMR